MTGTALRRARNATVTLAIAAAWVWIAPRFVGGDDVWLGAAMLTTLALAATLLAVATSAALLRKATGFDLDFVVGALWLPAMFSFALPPLAIVLGVIRLRRDTIGGYSTVRQGGSTHYPKIALAHGEARPFAYTLLAIGLLWPAIPLGLVLAG